ncbi:MAG: stage III sporulation protein AC [Clostridiales bacterium]|nr:stage III sporulation protein AC [Clostridiales bacterium]
MFDVDIIFKIAAIGISVAVLSTILSKAGREDQAMMTSLAGIIIVIGLVINMVAGLFGELQTLFSL